MNNNYQGGQNGYPQQQQQYGYNPQQQQQYQQHPQQGYQQPQQAGYEQQQQPQQQQQQFHQPQQQQQYPGMPPQQQFQQQSYQQYQQQQQQMQMQQGGAHGTTYQNTVKGLSGWNDPVFNNKQQADEVTDKRVLEGIESPSGLIVSGMEAALEKIRNNSPPSQKRMIDDTEKRLETLFEKLASNSIDEHTLAMLVHYTKCLNGGDFVGVNDVVMKLMNGFNVEDRWTMGVKRLAELFSRVSAQPQY